MGLDPETYLLAGLADKLYIALCSACGRFGLTMLGFPTLLQGFGEDGLGYNMGYKYSYPTYNPTYSYP